MWDEQIFVAPILFKVLFGIIFYILRAFLYVYINDRFALGWNIYIKKLQFRFWEQFHVRTKFRGASFRVSRIAIMQIQRSFAVIFKWSIVRLIITPCVKRLGKNWWRRVITHFVEALYLRTILWQVQRIKFLTLSLPHSRIMYYMIIILLKSYIWN